LPSAEAAAGRRKYWSQKWHESTAMPSSFAQLLSEALPYRNRVQLHAVSILSQQADRSDRMVGRLVVQNKVEVLPAAARVEHRIGPDTSSRAGEIRMCDAGMTRGLRQGISPREFRRDLSIGKKETSPLARNGSRRLGVLSREPRNNGQERLGRDGAISTLDPDVCGRAVRHVSEYAEWAITPVSCPSLRPAPEQKA
jgi:hypothetical protein